jgi:hypothetical protein
VVIPHYTTLHNQLFCCNVPLVLHFHREYGDYAFGLQDLNRSLHDSIDSLNGPQKSKQLISSSCRVGRHQQQSLSNFTALPQNLQYTYSTVIISHHCGSASLENIPPFLKLPLDDGDGRGNRPADTVIKLVSSLSTQQCNNIKAGGHYYFKTITRTAQL